MNHIKTETEEYYIDDQNRLQGESKSYYNNGDLHIHCFYVDNKRQGEYKMYHDNGELVAHCFYVDDELHSEFKTYHENGKLKVHCFFVNGEDITDEVKSLVSDIMNITDEEKLILKLQLGLDL